MTDQVRTIRTRQSTYLEPLDRDMREDRVTDQLRLEQAHRRRANGRLFLGIMIGSLIAIGAVMYSAREAGSFSGAGAFVDRQIDATAATTQDVAADTARTVGDAARTTGATVDQSLSGVADKAASR